MPALKEALCGDERVAVNDYSFGQVNTMACGPYMLCQSQSSRIIVLKCPLMFAEVVLNVLPDCALYTLGHVSRVSGTPCLCVHSWVQGPWGGLAGV